MSSRTSNNSQQSQAQPESRLGLHGAGWTKFMLWLMKVLPKPVCILLNTPICLIFYFLAKEQREALESNLTALCPDRPGRSFRDGLEVFRQFGLTYLDRLWHLHFNQPVEWDIVGMSHFDELKATSGGALIFTIHSGN